MSGRCAKDRALIALAMYEAAPHERNRLLRHLAGCSRCALRFRVLRELKKELRPGVESFLAGIGAPKAGPLLREAASRKLGRPAPSKSLAPSSPRGARFLASLSFKFVGGLLALLLVALGTGYFAVYRPLVRSEIRSPSSGLSLVGPVGRQARVPDVFRWTPVLHAEDYAVEVYDESLGRVFKGATSLVHELVVPAELRSRLARGKTYLWTVSARDGSGSLLTSRSSTFVID